MIPGCRISINYTRTYLLKLVKGGAFKNLFSEFLIPKSSKDLLFQLKIIPSKFINLSLQFLILSFDNTKTKNSSKVIFYTITNIPDNSFHRNKDSVHSFSKRIEKLGTQSCDPNSRHSNEENRENYYGNPHGIDLFPHLFLPQLY